MTLQINKKTDNNRQVFYEVDMIDLPGSPPTGRGKTKEEAMASLFFRLLDDEKFIKWSKYFKFSNLSILDKTT